MDRIAGKKHAAIAVAFGKQQVMAPRNDVADLEDAGEADQIADDRRKIRIRRQRGMQGEFLAVTLCNHAGKASVGKLIVTPLSRHDAFVEVVRPEDHLDEIADSSTALEPDAQLLADRAGATVAARQIVAAQRLLAAIHGADVNRHAALVLREVHELAAVAHRHVGRRFGDFLQQRFQLVL